MAIGKFGVGAVVGGALAYWLRGTLERSGTRAERIGRAVGADVYGAGSGFSGTTDLPPAAPPGERAERSGRATGARFYGASPGDS